MLSTQEKTWKTYDGRKCVKTSQWIEKFWFLPQQSLLSDIIPRTIQPYYLRSSCPPPSYFHSYFPPSDKCPFCSHHMPMPPSFLDLSLWFFHFYPVDLCNSTRSHFCDLQFLSLCLVHCPCLCPVCVTPLISTFIFLSKHSQYSPPVLPSTMHSVIEFRACAWESYNLLRSKYSIQYQIYYGQIMQTAQLQR